MSGFAGFLKKEKIYKKGKTFMLAKRKEKLLKIEFETVQKLHYVHN
jgi:hypothetical protein